MTARHLNPLAIIVLAYAAATGASSYLGIQDVRFVALFVIAWMLPISRMTLQDEPRSILRVQNKPGPHQDMRFLVVILGALPWFALPWLRRTYPESLLWQSVDMSDGLRWMGAVLTSAFVLWPLAWHWRTNTSSRRDGDETRTGSDVGPRFQSVDLIPQAITSASMFFASPNLFMALVAAAGFTVVCFTKPCGSTFESPLAEVTTPAV